MNPYTVYSLKICINTFEYAPIKNLNTTLSNFPPKSIIAPSSMIAERFFATAFLENYVQTRRNENIGHGVGREPCGQYEDVFLVPSQMDG